MRPTYTRELAGDVRAVQTMLRDVVDDPKSSRDEVNWAEEMLNLGSAGLAERIVSTQRDRQHFGDD
ncbi:Mycobacterium rhizamassiliense ORFan [Mycobacterium rhizamassiliense]|jgi:hypothetical protein|uniref:Mycobacterium rhizamassiliense ORFan n=1 Tax=Mycobacterium rhizamassiliense TaxID=1841860 RepID=A0A2U3NMU0_9MYCO|nr:hypothetical protein [Mycobacterium rhizamassiliense]SPM32764.1 Mycobacterium rhizamassiliense ORFan [Mycobacterium rhizamassiliense]